MVVCSDTDRGGRNGEYTLGRYRVLAVDFCREFHGRWNRIRTDHQCSDTRQEQQFGMCRGITNIFQRMSTLTSISLQGHAETAVTEGSSP
jgi:hypothetical protein